MRFNFNTPLSRTVFMNIAKNSASNNALFISSQNFLTTQPEQNQNDNFAAGIIALNKAQLLSGVDPTVLWETQIVDQQFLMPAALRTPMSGPSEPKFFIGRGPSILLDDGTTQCDSMNVFWANAAGLQTPLGVSVPMPQPLLFVPPLVARQPLPAVQYGLDTSQEAQSAVVFENTLYSVITQKIDATRNVVRWMQIDVSRALIDQTVALSQWGDVTPGDDLDAFLALVDVDEDGNMGTAFTVSGPSQYVSSAYTGRLATDKENAIRYPLISPLQSEFTYGSINTGLGLNLWGNYAAMQLDPVDGKTFYVLTQQPDPVGFFNPPNSIGFCNKTAGPCVSASWTMSVYTFQINDGHSCKDVIHTQPKHTVAYPAKSSGANNVILTQSATEQSTGEDATVAVLSEPIEDASTFLPTAAQ